MNSSFKPIYIIIGAVLLLTACSQNDEPPRFDGDGNQIYFRTALPQVSSRALETTVDNLPCFYVTAFNAGDPDMVESGALNPLFDNVKLDMVSGSDVYSSPLCVWPDPTKERHTVTFFGFYPGVDELPGTELENTSTLGSVKYRLKDFSVEEDIASQKDFLTAYASGTMADNLFSGVTIPFTHQLSRIEIKAFGLHKTCDIEIAGVRIGGVGVRNTFEFKAVDGGGEWGNELVPGIVEYVFRSGDKIVNIGKSTPVIEDDAVSIMGAVRQDGNENCAMLIPSNYSEWDSDKDQRNYKNQLYISVLLRVTDATINAGVNPEDTQRFPYRDLSQGADATKILPVYMAIKKESGEVVGRLYKEGDSFYMDAAHSEPYDMAADEEIKEFGWAALAVSGNWKPGNRYIYTLDYSHGVGLLDPEVSTSFPHAGDPVISDRVALTYSVKEWKVGGGDDFVVPEY